MLPGVEITATQTGTGIPRTTLTNETGSYVLPNLALGPHRVEAALPGFRTFAQTGIVLQVNSSPVINVVLEIGQVAETVEAQANAGLVETWKSSVGTVIENQRILELPLNGRNVTELITLAGGAVNPYAPNKSIALWLNPAAFEMPAVGTYGNTGSRNVYGPGSIRIDMGLTRAFPVREGQSVELRAEAFNLPNHVNPGNPVTTWTSSTFGRILDAADPRIIQFALKYVF